MFLLWPFTKIAKMVLLGSTKWPPELKKPKPFKQHLHLRQWPDFIIISQICSSYAFIPKLLDTWLNKVATRAKKNTRDFFPCWCFTEGLLSLLGIHIVFFPCWCCTWSSFLLVLHKFSTYKFCHGNQTKWPSLIDISQAIHHHFHKLS